MIKILRLENKSVLTLFTWLKAQKLKGGSAGDSRKRTDFLRLILPFTEIINDKRKEIVGKYTKLENGSAVIIEENGVKTYEFFDGGEEKATDEVGKYLKEYSVIHIPRYLRTCYDLVKSLVLGCEIEFS